jgi:hypothetical protein
MRGHPPAETGNRIGVCPATWGKMGREPAARPRIQPRMSRFRANKNVHSLYAKIDALDRQRRELEVRAFGAEVPVPVRRDRYFGLPDAELRRKLIGMVRRLRELGIRHHDARVAYWQLVTDETRAKLDDLRSDAPRSSWRRGIWWDVLTVFWILAGFGLLTFQIPGAVVGAIAAAIWARHIVKSRAATRIAFLREGDDALRSSESQLQQARREAAAAQAVAEPFSATEEQSGVPDAPGELRGPVAPVSGMQA